MPHPHERNRMQAMPNPTAPSSRVRIAQLHAELAPIIERHTRGQAPDCVTAIPNLGLWRREQPARPVTCLLEPSVVLVAQGAKRLLVGGEGFDYGIDRFLVTSLDLPANSEVVEASADVPCVGLVFKLDTRVLAELVTQGGLAQGRVLGADRRVGVEEVTVPVLEPFVRLVRLLDEPDAIPTLAPLIQREIHYRLLVGDRSGRLWQIASIGSQSHRIARAIDWLKLNYAQPLSIEDLAARVRMSASSLHHHFRQLTAMSPLQYQKWLRLNEARRLMLNEGADAAAAAFAVGYESPSQFSREYSRLFGAPPRRDVDGLRPRPAQGLPPPVRDLARRRSRSASVAE
jgi:AraC-like DNA-binding protein